jgi:hypothetical protein
MSDGSWNWGLLWVEGPILLRFTRKFCRSSWQTKQTFEKFFTGKTRLTGKLEIILQNTGPGGPVTAMEVSST